LLLGVWMMSGAMPVGAGISAPMGRYQKVHAAMGTEFTIFVYADSESDADTICESAFEEVDRIEQLLSNYRESSELSRINRNAANAAVTTDPEMLNFLEQAAHWSSVSDGGFDITVGRLMKAWGFYRHSGRIPSDEELNELRSATGWRKVQIDGKERTVHFTSAGVELDPGGIGKGFAVDAVVRVLREQHVTAALISAGSSTVYALGAPPGQDGWRIVIPGPLPGTDPLSILSLRDTSISSADCSQKNFTIHGHLYCHIMDPRTMRPVEGRIQVSVVDPSATASDALSNVVFVEPPEQIGRILSANAPESRALLVVGGSSSQEPGSARCLTFHWGPPVSTLHCGIERMEAGKKAERR
jgi:thiamine biosynthesis lipoprotein